MDRFDLFTILILYASMTFLFSMFLISTAVTLKHKFKGIIHIILGFLLFSIGMTFLTMREYLPLELYTSTLFGNYTLIAGIFILNLGIRKLFGIRSNSKIYRTVYVAYVLLFFYFAAIDINVSIGIILSALVISLFFMRTVFYLVQKARITNEKYIYNLSFMLSAYAVTHSLRIISVIIDYNHINDFLSYTQDVIFQLTGILALFLIFIYIIIIINKLLSKELEDKLEENEILISTLEELTKIDYLTGLFNRKSLEEKTYELIEKCQESHQTFQYILIDINDFKEINDRYGHPFGDQILINFGQMLQNHTHLVYRCGGDEFVMILEEPLFDAEKLMNEMTSECSIDVTKNHLIPCFSYGIHVWKDGQSCADMMREADLMMYRHKRVEATS